MVSQPGGAGGWEGLGRRWRTEPGRGVVCALTVCRLTPWLWLFFVWPRPYRLVLVYARSRRWTYPSFRHALGYLIFRNQNFLGGQG